MLNRTLTIIVAALTALTLTLGCDLIPVEPSSTSSATSTEDTSTSGTDTGEATGGSTGGSGYVCPDVGKACDPQSNAEQCAAGLDCVPTGEPSPAPAGVCAEPCNHMGGVQAEPCAIGWCDALIDGYGMCRDGDGLPTGLCEGVPACAGDPCSDGCANGLECIAGACAFACKVAADCGDGQVCLAGACFEAGGGLANPCN